MGRTMPYLTGLAVVAVLSTGFGAYLLTGGEDARTVIALLCFAVSVALIVAIAAIYHLEKSARADRARLVESLRSDLTSFEMRIQSDNARVEVLEQQMTEVRHASQQSHEAMSNGLQELRQGYTEMSGQLREAVSAISSSLAQPQASHYGYAAYPVQPEYNAANDIHEVVSPVAMPYGEEAVYEAPAEQLGESDAAQEHDEQFDEPEDLKPTIVDDEVYAPPPPPQAAAAPPPRPLPEAQPAPRVPRMPKAEELVTSLEPVIDLFTNKTSHYRLHLSMLKPNGTEVPTDTLLHHADRSGLRTHFDVHAAREALGLLRHLRERDGQLNIFMPLGASTLQSAETIERLQELRKEFGNVAAGLVFELPHATLAGLSERGLEGLARLARDGVHMALTNVAMAGVDLVSLAKLNVRYLSLNSTTALGATGPTPNVLQFAQTARANRIMLIVTNITNPSLAKHVSKIGRYVAGPAFAAPRRVKQGVALESVRPSRSAA